ncbi:cytidylyltransferase domain-containing protein [Thalassospira alkalitolerans]|uniref:acylneuraminate cytidylyltransferase family protein n=1 Tax=Thalassospira alkalitolerans TaxID=1293890 RepID=UPI003AA8DDC1
MIAALMIGKHNSGTVKGKNYKKLLGRPMCEYPLMAAHHCSLVDKIFVSTDSPNIAEIGTRYGASIIDRPSELAQASSPTEFVFSHAYEEMQSKGTNPEFLVLMFANSPDVLPGLLEQGITMLRDDPDLDSVLSVSRYNMFTPLRARKMNEDGTSSPVLDLPALNIPNTFDRDAMGDIYFADFGIQIVRPERCLVDPVGGALPFRWLGQKQGALKKAYGFDIDEYWQIPVIEHWLREHGFTETTTPYER